jgi:hypothetical protein
MILYLSKLGIDGVSFLKYIFWSSLEDYSYHRVLKQHPHLSTSKQTLKKTLQQSKTMQFTNLFVFIAATFALGSVALEGQSEASPLGNRLAPRDCIKPHCT